MVRPDEHEARLLEGALLVVRIRQNFHLEAYPLRRMGFLFLEWSVNGMSLQNRASSGNSVLLTQCSGKTLHALSALCSG